MILAGEPFVWPCDFIETPPGAYARPVLGRAGLWSEFDVEMDDEYLTLIRRTRSKLEIWATL